MIIKILKNLFIRESRSEERQEITLPVDTEESCEKDANIKFGADVKALSERWGELKSGLCINTTLQELLTIVNRKRARVDAYNSLVKHLKANYGVTLIIKSRKR